MKRMVAVLCIMLSGLPACTSDPLVDESELQENIASDAEELLHDSESTDPTSPPDSATTSDTSAQDTDSETASASDVTVDTGSELPKEDTETSEPNDDVVDSSTDSEVADVETPDSDTEDMDSEMETLDSETVGVDSETEMFDSETEVFDSETEARDTATTQNDTAVEDTDVVIVDTATETVEPCVPTLVINEIDYDVPGVDNAEFVEIVNPTICEMPLEGIALVLVNGSNMSEYRRIHLSDAGVDALLPHEYMIIYGDQLALDSAPVGIPLSLASGFIQNGPDGVLLLDTADGAVLDAFCYGEPMTSVDVNGVADPLNLVEGLFDASLLDTSAEGTSLSRVMDGVDTQEMAVDWVLGPHTPGLPNTVQP